MTEPADSAPSRADPLAGARPEAADLVRAVSLDVERIRLAPLYRGGLLVAAATMLLLPLVYVGLILVVAYGIWFHATHNYVMLVGGGGAQARIVGYLAPIVAGGLGVLFMIKPLFAPAPERPEPRTLGRDDEPLLYAYVDALCASLGAPKPQRIDVDMQVNASASFRRGFLSFLGTDLVLTLGLPLTAGMTLGEWTGVLAHEFGHFTQGAAMRFTYVIGSVNHWFARVVHERDAWDERLDRWVRSTKSGWAQVVLLISKAFIWLSRRVLWVLMMIGLAVSSFLSRQMEYNADLHQARISGSKLFRAAHLRIPILGIAWQRATAYLSEMWGERRLVDDVVTLVLSEAERLAADADVSSQIEQGMERGSTGAFDTHPATRDRIRAVERLALPAHMDDSSPASVVFHDFGALSRELTLTFYEAALGHPVESTSLVDADAALAEQRVRIEGGRALDRYFLGSELVGTGVFPAGAEAPAIGPDVSAARIAESSRRMLDAVPEVRARIEDLDRIGKRRRMAALLVRARAAKVGLDPERAEVSPADASDPGAAAQEAANEYRATLTALAPHAAEAVARLEATLGLVGEPTVAGSLARNAGVAGRLPGLLSTLRALEPWWPTLRDIQRELFELSFLLDQAGPTIQPGELQDQVLELWASLRRAAAGVRDRLGDAAYPYDHAHGPTSLAKYLFDHVPEVGPAVGPAVANGGQRLVQLYFRVWSDLASLALEVEEILGLPTLEPLPPAEEPGGDA